MGTLAGRRVVVTRPAEHAGGLVDLLRAENATAIVVPLVTIVDDATQIEALGSLDCAAFDWIIVTSRNAAERLVVAHGATLGEATMSRPRLAAVGTATAAVLKRVDVVPVEQSAEGLLTALPHDDHRTALVVQAADAEPALVDGLRGRGWTVTVVTPHRGVPARPSGREQLAALSADAVLFASGSAARAWVAVFGETTPPIVVAIGPRTAAAAVAAGLKVSAIAADHSLVGLVDALRQTFE